MAYTNIKRNDGFGAQLQSIISTIIYCDINNVEFKYSKFTSIEHNYDSDPDYVEKLEDFINISKTYPLATDEPALHNWLTWTENNIDIIQDFPVLDKLRNIFHKDKVNIFDTSFYNIAVHIRRPNIHDNRIDGTDTTDSHFLNAIAKLSEIYREKNIKFHIYSQGNIDDFSLYKNDTTKLHINENIIDTFTGLTQADVLVTSRSSFSYIAGFLNRNTIYYTPFWHRPLSNWNVIPI